jgi:DNA topoisomerase I
MESFKPKEYWVIDAAFSAEKDKIFDSVLTSVDGNRLNQLSIENQTTANEYVDRIKRSDFTVSKIKQSKMSRSPLPPFSTSTLQQDASSRLGFSVGKTMTVIYFLRKL